MSIYELLPLVSKDVGAVGKTGKNEAQNYKFRSADALMNALHPALHKNGVTVRPRVIDRWCEVRSNSKGSALVHAVLTVEYVWTAPDGSELITVTVGESIDYGDKAHNKAMTAAWKYAVSQTLTIPLEDITDGDAESPDAGQVKAARGRAVAERELAHPTRTVPGPDQYVVTSAASVTKQSAPDDELMIAQGLLRARVERLNGSQRAFFRDFLTGIGAPHKSSEMSLEQIASANAWLDTEAAA